MATGVWIIGGFLGAGKTTLIMRLAGELSAGGTRKLAIIVNDFGDIGVDQRVLKEVCPSVYELFAGCVCCQLSVDLIQTIDRMRAEMNPDLVLIEPSGIAEPARILQTLRQYARGLGAVRTLTVVDGSRFGELLDALEPLIAAQVRFGDLLAINKVDLLSPEEIAQVRRAARELNSKADVLEVSALATEDVRRVADVMASFEGPNAYAASIEFSAATPLPAERWAEVLVSLVQEATCECVRLGATVVGHVKAFADGPDGLRLYCSSIGPQQRPSIRRIDEHQSKAMAASFDGVAKSMLVHLNAIVFGLSPTELAQGAARSIEASAEQWSLQAQVRAGKDISLR